MASDESTAIVTGAAAFEAKVVMLRRPGPPPSPPPLPPPLPTIAADVDTEDDEEAAPSPGPVRAAAAVAAAAAAKPGKMRGSSVFNADDEDCECEDDCDRDGDGTVSVYDAVVQPLNSAAGFGKRPSHALQVTSNDGDDIEEEEDKNESEDGDTASAVVTGFKKQLISRWSGKTTTDGGGRNKRRRPTLVHYGEHGQMPIPAKYAPGTRIGNLIEKELMAVRATGNMRVQVKMNLRGRAKLEAFLLNLTHVARGALRIAVPQLIGYRKALCGDGDATGVRLALADLDNRQLRLLDALFDRLRTRSVVAVWSIIVEETSGGRGIRLQ